MILYIQDVLDAGTLSAVQERLAFQAFDDGATSAGWAAKQVKRNEQARDDKTRAAIVRLVEERLRAHPLFASAALPKSFPRILINRYGPGMHYGSHMDDAVIHGQRTDLSFTLGLTPAADYEGGELVLEDSTGDRAWKVDAGDLLLYPTTYLHRVEAVRTGQRMAVVGWVRSLVRRSEQREILLDLDIALRTEFDAHGKTEQFDRLSRSRNNLLRLWLED